MALAITTTTAPMTHGTGNRVVLAATGATGPVKWNLVGGSLPPGVRFSSDGLLQGIPSCTGTWVIKVSAFDTGTYPSPTGPIGPGAGNTSRTAPGPAVSGTVTITIS